MNTKQKMQLYDRLYRHADKLIKKYNPCKIEGKTCLHGINPCCDGCKYLGENGCTVECLVCKLCLCYIARSQSPKLSRTFNRMREQAYTHRLLSLRTSRKDMIDRLNEMYIQDMIYYNSITKKAGIIWTAIKKRFGISLKINQHIL